MKHLLGLVFALSVASVAGAGEPSDETLRYMQQAANLDTHRDDVEKRLAAEQVRAYRLEQRVKALEKELADLKAKPPAPKEGGE